jgi:hypothetical protein
LLLESGARLAAVGDLSSDGAITGLRASTASLGAGGPGRPGRDDAVHGARLGVASALLVKRALHTPVLGHDDDSDRANLAAGATGAAASCPCIERVLTVDRARVSVAVLLLSESGASYATMRSSGGHGAGTLGDATTTLVGASAPDTKARELAVDRAGLSVACDGVNEFRAGNTSVGVLDHNSPGAVFGATTTADGAGSEVTPSRHRAINGA